MPAQENSQPLELSITRHINATPARVWQLMTEHLTEWWCPRPWWTEIVEQDWRAGGRTAMIMHGPDTDTGLLEGVFLEVTPGRRFVSTDAVNAQWQPQQPFMIGTFEINEEDGGTRYTASARHWTKEAMEEHKAMGFEPGWSAVAEQLATLAERTSFTKHVIDAPIEKVFAAMKDPQRLTRWWGPNGFTSTFREFEFREGGNWLFTMHGPDGTDYPNENRFTEIAENRRVVIEHLSDEHHFTLAINLTADGDRTVVGWYQMFDTIEHYREIADFVGKMNEQNLDRLVAEVCTKV